MLLEKTCAAVPAPASAPAVGTDSDYPDFITNLLLTVLDLRLQNPIVNNAIEFYRANRWDEIRSLDDLEGVLSRFPEGRGWQQVRGEVPLGVSVWGPSRVAARARAMGARDGAR